MTPSLHIQVQQAASKATVSVPLNNCAFRTRMSQVLRNWLQVPRENRQGSLLDLYGTAVSVLTAVGRGGRLQVMGTSVNPYMANIEDEMPALLTNGIHRHTASQQRHLIVQVKRYIRTQEQQAAKTQTQAQSAPQQ
jgi:hypothetical protein